MNFLLLIEFWVLYFFIHSFLASGQVKNLFERWLGRGFRLYRLAYSFISTIGLLFLLLFNASLSSELLFTNEGLIRYLSLMLATFGVIVISQSFREYRFSSFIGLRDEPSEFKKTGVLKFVRHPIYSGTILIVIGFFLFNPTRSTLISVCCILSYLPIGIYLGKESLLNILEISINLTKRKCPPFFQK